MTETVLLLPLYAFMASQGYHHRYLLPKQSQNLGETTFFLYPNRIWVFGKTGTASCLASSGLGKKSMTVSMAGNAFGENLPPLILFKGRNWWDS